MTQSTRGVIRRNSMIHQCRQSADRYNEANERLRLAQQLVHSLEQEVVAANVTLTNHLIKVTVNYPDEINSNEWLAHWCIGRGNNELHKKAFDAFNAGNFDKDSEGYTKQ